MSSDWEHLFACLTALISAGPALGAEFGFRYEACYVSIAVGLIE